uniref:ARAD1B00418p n=1 Tax=Blastobotrys adeninivorans TaxID=409370 RepID=A0A060T506_BLAAD
MSVAHPSSKSFTSDTTTTTTGAGSEHKSPSRHHSLITPKSTANAAAEYQYAKNRRYGVYSGPGTPVVGVPTRSSDTAAVLAAQSDLSLKLWHRESVSPKAASAALLANQTNSSPDIWQPSPNASAGAAAVLAKDRTRQSQKARNKPSMVALTKASTASQAALSAHHVPAHVQAANALPDAYAWNRTGGSPDAVRSASLRVHNDSQKLQEQRDHELSDSAAAAALYGGSSDLHRSATMPVNKMDLSLIEGRAREKAQERLSHLYLNSESGNVLKFSATGAAAAPEALPASQQEIQSRYLKERDHFIRDAAKNHEKIMQLARERAQKELYGIDRSVTEKNPLHNAIKMEVAALAIAEKQSAERMQNHGKIDIGGGKFMTQSEVEAIAQRNVKPVLDEIAEVAEKQRIEDEERRQAEEEARERQAEEHRLQQEMRAEDKRLRNEEKAKSKVERDKERAILKEKRAQEKAERKKRDAELKAERKLRQTELKHSRMSRLTELKHGKLSAKEQRKIRDQKLQAAVDEASHAEELARVEVQKLTALKEAAAAQLEQARLAEEEHQGEDGNEELAQAAAVVRQNKEEEFDRASTILEAAVEKHEALKEETRKAKERKDKDVLEEDEEEAKAEGDESKVADEGETAEATNEAGEVVALKDLDETADAEKVTQQHEVSHELKPTNTTEREMKGEMLPLSGFIKDKTVPEDKEAESIEAAEPAAKPTTETVKEPETAEPVKEPEVGAKEPVSESTKEPEVGVASESVATEPKPITVPGPAESIAKEPEPVTVSPPEVSEPTESAAKADAEPSKPLSERDVRSSYYGTTSNESLDSHAQSPLKEIEESDDKAHKTLDPLAKGKEKVTEEPAEPVEAETAAAEATAATETEEPVNGKSESVLETRAKEIAQAKIKAAEEKLKEAREAKEAKQKQTTESKAGAGSSESESKQSKKLFGSIRGKFSSLGRKDGQSGGRAPGRISKMEKHPLPTASDATAGLANVAARAVTEPVTKAEPKPKAEVTPASKPKAKPSKDEDVDLERTFSGFSDVDESAVAGASDKKEGVFKEQI